MDVIAVASITIQLADSVKKLSDFWKSVQQAPSDVQTIITDLDLLRQALGDIASGIRQGNSSGALERTLQQCEVNVQTLYSILQQLEPGFASSKRIIRKFTAFKSVLKWDKVKKFMAVLDRLKSTMMLFSQDINRSPFDALSDILRASF